MTRYTQEKKEHALSLMAAPQNKPVADVAQLTGIPEGTLCTCGENRPASKGVPCLAMGRILNNGVLPTSSLSCWRRRP